MRQPRDKISNERSTIFIADFPTSIRRLIEAHAIIAAIGMVELGPLRLAQTVGLGAPHDVFVDQAELPLEQTALSRLDAFEVLDVGQAPLQLVQDAEEVTLHQTVRVQGGQEAFPMQLGEVAFVGAVPEQAPISH